MSTRLDNLLRHVENVRDDCVLLGRRLIEAGEDDLGLRLIANGHVHDASKFNGIEWEYLNDNEWPFPGDNGIRLAAFKLALHQHVTTNQHHPEYWGGIEQMPSVFLAECLCDWHARSSEQGSNLHDWVRVQAPERFKYPTSGRVHKELKRFMELLLEKPFK
jgi:hypothetical protein